MTDSVLVEPLAPPFDEDIMVFAFDGTDEHLAVSRKDGDKIIALLGGKARGREIVLGPAEGGKIRVHAGQ